MKDVTGSIRESLAAAPGRPPEVTIVGDLNYDYIYSCPALEGGREVFISAWSRQTAGAGGYAACGLARLGAAVSFVTELGDDGDGRALFDDLERRGIRRDGTRLLAGRQTPFTLIFSDESSGRPRQVASLRGSLESFTVRPGDYESHVARSQLLYSCSYFVMPALRRDIGALFRRARASGIRTAYDANGGDGWADPEALALLKEDIYPRTDFIFLNAEEARCLTGERDPDRAAAAVQPREATVVVKRGADGVLLREEGRLTAVGAFPLRDRLVDTVGAGDSFQAAFLFFALRGLPLPWCAALGAANGASTVTRTGGTAGQLDAAGLSDFLGGYRIREEAGRIAVEPYQG
jgi:sugar/nucleoside kinase (ribokinase family)